MAAACANDSVRVGTPESLGTIVENEGDWAEASLLALRQVCGPSCGAASSGAVIVELSPFDKYLSAALAAGLPGISILTPSQRLSNVLQDIDEPTDGYKLFAPRNLGGLLVVRVESNLNLDEGKFDFRSDDVVLESSNEGWKIVSDPSALGVTVTSSVS